MTKTYSSRNTDQYNEKSLTEFLRRHLAPHITNFVTYDDRANQLGGIDATGDVPSKGLSNVKIDVKGLLGKKYHNRNIRTLSFEVFGKFNDTIRELGWLFDQHKETEAYLCADIFTDYYRKGLPDEFAPYSFAPEGIWFVDMLLVSRPKLLDYLKTQAITKETAEAKATRLRESGGLFMFFPSVGELILDEAKGKAYVKERNPAIYLRRSAHLQEQPITIIANRQVLRDHNVFILEERIMNPAFPINQERLARVRAAFS